MSAHQVRSLLPYIALTAVGCVGSGAASQPTGETSMGKAIEAHVTTESTPPPGFVASAGGGFRSTGHRRAVSTTLDEAGAHLSVGKTPADEGFALALAAVARSSGASAQLAHATWHAGPGRAERVVGAGISEWVVDGERGLEHGIDLAERLPGDGELALDVAIEGLSARRLDSTSMVLEDSMGRLIAHYDGLAVRDARGHHVDAEFVDSVRGRIRIVVRDQDAVYPLVIDPLVWGTLVAEFKPAGRLADDHLSPVAVHASTMLVGAPGHDGGKGIVYVLANGPAGWTEQAQIQPADAAPGDRFGTAIAFDGATAIISSPQRSSGGVVYFYTPSGGLWQLQQEFVTPKSDGEFGDSVAIDGDLAAIGDPYLGSMTGAAYVVARTGTSWSEVLVPPPVHPTESASFGSSVAVSGNTVVIGESHTNAVVYVQSGGTWSLQGTLWPTKSTGTSFGAYAALDHDLLLIADPYASAGPFVYAFTRTGTTWTVESVFTPTGGSSSASFGTSLAIVGNLAVVGDSNGGPKAFGAAFLYERSSTGWSPTGGFQAPDGMSFNDRFGSSVATDGTTIAVGAPGVDSAAGAAYIFAQAHAVGDACTANADCVSGACVDGVCCSAATCGGCGTCNGSSPGTCSPRAAGTVAAACSPYVCDGTLNICPSSCANDASCTVGAHCDSTKHVCVATGGASDAGMDSDPGVTDAASDGGTMGTADSGSAEADGAASGDAGTAEASSPVGGDDATATTAVDSSTNDGGPAADTAAKSGCTIGGGVTVPSEPTAWVLITIGGSLLRSRRRARRRALAR